VGQSLSTKVSNKNLENFKMKKIQVKDKFREQLEVNKLIKEYLYKGGKIRTVPKVEREAA